MFLFVVFISLELKAASKCPGAFQEQVQSFHYRSVNGNQDFFRDVFDGSLEKRLGYFFKNRHLEIEALTHKGMGGKKNRFHNERLEFLGDAVFNLYVFEWLMRRYPIADKQEIYKKWAIFVSNDAQAEIALIFKLDRNIQLQDKKTTGIQPKRVLADMLEALVGAVYLDGGYLEAQQLVARLIKKIELYKHRIFPLGEAAITLQRQRENIYSVQSRLNFSQDDLINSDVHVHFPGLEKAHYLKPSIYNFHYDRLQFLGYTVFRLCLTDILMRKYTEANEGHLSKKRELFTNVVNSRQISDLDWNIQLKVEEVWDKVRIVPWITLSSVFKFLLGAIYLDEGYMEARKLVIQLLGEDIKQPSINGSDRNIFDKNDSKKVSREAIL